MNLDYLTSFIDGSNEPDFEERKIIVRKLNARIDRLNKKIKKMQLKAKENLNRWL